MRDAYKVEVKEFIAEYAAAYRSDAYATVLDIQFIDYLGDYLVCCAMITARAVGERLISE